MLIRTCDILQELGTESGVPKSARQDDGTDCGVFCVAVVLCLAKGRLGVEQLVTIKSTLIDIRLDILHVVATSARQLVLEIEYVNAQGLAVGKQAVSGFGTGFAKKRKTIEERMSVKVARKQLDDQPLYDQQTERITRIQRGWTKVKMHPPSRLSVTHRVQTLGESVGFLSRRGVLLRLSRDRRRISTSMINVSGSRRELLSLMSLIMRVESMPIPIIWSSVRVTIHALALTLAGHIANFPYSGFEDASFAWR